MAKIVIATMLKQPLARFMSVAKDSLYNALKYVVDENILMFIIVLIEIIELVKTNVTYSKGCLSTGNLTNGFVKVGKFGVSYGKCFQQ